MKDKKKVYPASKYLGMDTYKKSNTLILSRSTPPLMTNKLFMICTMRAEKQKDGSLTAVIPGKTLRKIFNNSSGSFYERVKKACYDKDNPGNRGTLMDYRAVFEDNESEQWSAHNLVMDAEFANGVLSITFNPKMEKHIVGMKKDYTSLNVDEMMGLTNNYSYRFAELFKREAAIQEWFLNKTKGHSDEPYVVTYNLTDLKLMLGIIDSSNPKVLTALKKDDFDAEYIDSFDENSTKIFSNFRRNVLDVAKKEMDERASIRFDYELIRTGIGGKVTAIRFLLYKNDINNDDTEENKSISLSLPDMDDMIDELRDHISEYIPTKDLRAIINAAEGDMEKIKYAYTLTEGKEVDNLTGFMISAIKNDYKKIPKSDKKKSSFDNFEERNDNYDDFVRKLK